MIPIFLGVLVMSLSGVLLAYSWEILTYFGRVALMIMFLAGAWFCKEELERYI